MSVGIVTGFFSPCDFERPRQHALATLEMLRPVAADVVFVQVVKTGQDPLPVPAGIRNIVLQSDDVMFFKENLWNIGAAVTDSDKLIFLDADVLFCDDNWLEQISAALDTYDIIQPFEKAEWLDWRGLKLFERQAAFVALSQGLAPLPHKYHPGFGVGMTRVAYRTLHGLYDQCVIGGGDTAFAFAFANDVESQQYLTNKHDNKITMFGAQSYKKFRQRALNSRFQVGFVPGLRLQHLWHGSALDRQYGTRHKYFGGEWTVPGGYEAPVFRRPDGLLAWAVPQPGAVDYFCSRHEDNLGALPKKYHPIK
jgi:hypothetical protein